MTDGTVAGIDIGGTKIATLIVGPDGTVRGRATHPTSVSDASTAVDAIVACLDAALGDAGLERDDLATIGVGVPGRVDPARGHVTLAVNLAWTDFALRDALEAATGRPVRVENDARAAAIGLHRRGAAHRAAAVIADRDGDHAREHAASGATDEATNGAAHRSMHDGDLAYLAVGTGIAAGIVLDGRLHRGARGLAGEIGHTVIDAGGPTCGCGQRGCLEAFASGPSIARRAIETGARPSTTAVDVYRAAAAGEPWATDLAEDVGRRLAWAIHTLVMAYDVETIVVGGGVSHAGAPFSDPLHREIRRLRSTSALAAALMPAKVDVLPAEAEPGAWGAVTIARTAAGDPTPVDQGSAVVGHV